MRTVAETLKAFYRSGAATRTAIAIWEILLVSCDDDGLVVASQNSLATDNGWDRRIVKRSIDDLTSHGLIRPTGRSHQRAREYQIVGYGPPAADLDSQPEDAETEPKSCTDQGSKVAQIRPVQVSDSLIDKINQSSQDHGVVQLVQRDPVVQPQAATNSTSSSDTEARQLLTGILGVLSEKYGIRLRGVARTRRLMAAITGLGEVTAETVAKELATHAWDIARSHGGLLTILVEQFGNTLAIEEAIRVQQSQEALRNRNRMNQEHHEYVAARTGRGPTVTTSCPDRRCDTNAGGRGQIETETDQGYLQIAYCRHCHPQSSHAFA